MERGQGFVIAIATAVMGVFVSGLLMAWNNVPIVTKPENSGWLAVRGFLGGCSCIAAFVAVGKLDLAVANTLMFTMPLWTALFAYLIIGKPWDRYVALGELTVKGPGDDWGVGFETNGGSPHCCHPS